ncbi:MAG TPA: hypothetical protein VII52_13710 [Gemmatimonadaceae bacterium]
MIRVGALAVGMGCLAFRAARAQSLTSPPGYMEYRADAIVARAATAEAGLGAVIPAGAYVRVSLDGAAGASWRNAAFHPSGRIDAVGRFLLDPFRETPVALSLGGGVSVPYVDGQRVRPYLTLVADLEGRKRGAITPAVQIGLGGGARVGVVLRTSVPRWR